MLRNRKRAIAMINQELEALDSRKADALIKTLFHSEQACRIMIRTLLAIDLKCFQAGVGALMILGARQLAYNFYARLPQRKTKKPK